MRTLQEVREAVKLPLAKQIVDSMAAAQERVTMSFLSDAAYLNSKDEWSMDDNFNTTEGIVLEASVIAGTDPIDPEAQEAWREIAAAFGHDVGDEGLGGDDEDHDDTHEEDPET